MSSRSDGGPSVNRSDVEGCDVVVRHVGTRGLTTIRSYVVDVSVDGDAVEVAAEPGHLFSIAEATLLDGDDEIDETAGR